MAELAWKVDEQGADLELAGGNLALDAGLVPAVLCALFSDRRADIAELSQPGADPRGFWAEDVDRPWGSKLWLLYRSTLGSNAVGLAIRYAEEALRVFIEEDVAQLITVDAEVHPDGFLDVEVTIKRGGARRRSEEWAASPSEVENRFPRGSGIVRIMFVS